MWDERYREPGFYYGTEPNDFLVEHAARVFSTGGEILSLGEGEGRNAVFLAGLGLRVTAVDGSPVGLAKARALATERGVRIDTVVADLASFELGRSCWDGIVSLWCHTPSALRRRLHRDVVDALRPGGVFLLEAYTPDQLAYRTGGPSSVDLLVTLAAAREELAGLDVVVGVEKIREVVEGAHHGGTSAVVQVIARKPAAGASGGDVRQR
jgi:SAM-dependent methyltransferase